ncbi:hypothetical protein ES708_32354 [subsurface metagenome]
MRNEKKLSFNEIVIRFIVSPIIILAVIASIVSFITWRTTINMKIATIEKTLGNIEKQIGNATSIDENPSYTEEEYSKKTIHGYLGHMNPNLIKDNSKSFWGIKYHLDKNICEINLSSSTWQESEILPYPGLFLVITNLANNYKTWCMPIGTIKDKDNPQRILIVSRKVSNQLGIPSSSLINASIKVSVMGEEEWKKDKNCTELYNLLNIREMIQRFSP